MANRFKTRESILALPDRQLRALVHTTNPAGRFAEQHKWAFLELRRRQEVSRADSERSAVANYVAEGLGEI